MTAVASSKPEPTADALILMCSGGRDSDMSDDTPTDVDLLPDEAAEHLSTTCRTAAGDSVRSVVYFSRTDHQQIYLRGDLSQDADLDTFGQGEVHIILGHPYGPTDWKAFDQSGNVRDLDVLDVDLPDPEEFFDFTEADLDIDYTEGHRESGGRRR